jgi:hypothetical protein
MLMHVQFLVKGGIKRMEEFNIYRDIAERTQGDIYIGVVGPVSERESLLLSKGLWTCWFCRTYRESLCKGKGY